jgi:hypothetical protein
VSGDLGPGSGGRRGERRGERSASHPALGDGEVNERVTVPASGAGSGDREVNARVNGGAHPSGHEPASRPPASPGFRSGLHRRRSPLVADGEANAWGTALPP